MRRIEGITLMLTKACDMRCTYCFEKHQGYAQKYMTPEIAVKSVKLLLADSNTTENSPHIEYSCANKISLFGGEPTLNRKAFLAVIQELENYTGDRVVELMITTNMYRLNTEIYDKLNELAKNNPKIIIDVTVSGILHQKYHDEDRINTRGEGTYSQIIENLRYCRKMYTNIHFTIHSVISKKCIPHITEIFDSSLKILDELNLRGNNSYSLVSSNTDGGVYTKEELKYWYEDYIHRDKSNMSMKELERMYMPIAVSLEEFYPRELSVCRALKTELFVDWNGRIEPCHKSVEFGENSKLSIGSIVDVKSYQILPEYEEFDNILDGNVNFISELTGTSCNVCPFSSKCHTCLLGNYTEKDGFKYKSKEECMRTLALAELTLEYEKVKQMKDINTNILNLCDRVDELGNLTVANSEALSMILHSIVPQNLPKESED